MTVTTSKPVPGGGGARPPRGRPPGPELRPAPNVLVPGLVAAAWAVGAGLVAFAVPVLLAWASDGRSGAGAAEATRTAGQLWLLAHGTPLALSGGTVGLTPLGLAALPLMLLHRAGRHGARTIGVDSFKDSGLLLLATALPYALATAAVAALAATKAVRPEAPRALLGALLVAALGAGSGIVREAGVLRSITRLPDGVRVLARATAASVGVLLAGGALVVGISLAVHGGQATTLAGATDPGLVGGLGLLVLGLSLVPNAAVWGLSFATGPGFAVGVGTSVGPLSIVLGPVPAFPLLAALPGGDVSVWVGGLLLLIPLGAGIVGGLLVASRRSGSAGRAALEACAVGPCAGVATALLCLLSGGPLGSARLAAVGPSPWRVGLAVLVEVAAPAAAAAAIATHRRT